MAFVDYQKKGSIVTITLNRPERLNALGREITSDLADALKKYQDDKEARVAILTGAGRAFCAGMDINEAGAPPEVRAYEHVDAVKKPVIAAINGFALGAGCLTALACDIRIAAQSSRLGMPEIKRGIAFVPTRLLVQGISACIVEELCMTGEHFTAQRSYEAGMINKVVPDADLMKEAVKMAETIAALSPWAVGLIKEAKIKALALSPEEDRDDRELSRKMRQSPAFKEGTAAFLQKQKPTFKQ